MPSPYTGSPTRSISLASSSVEHDELINPLLGPVAWGSPFTLAIGGSYALTYSFPWLSSISLATFAPDYGKGEDKAATRFGLNSTQQQAFETALQSWASVANISFSEITETSTNVGEIRIAFSSAVGDDAAGHAWLPSSYYAQGGDIWLNPETFSGPWAKNSDNLHTLVHELGHALGLTHPNDQPYTSSNLYTVMSYVSAPNSTWITDLGNNKYSYRYIMPEGPQLHDILAIQYLYGANYKYNSGDNTYTFDPSIPFFRTLWDGGGKDTISASNFSEPVTINLNAGSFSSLTIKSISPNLNWTTPPKEKIYDGTNNLAIAYGAVIENAVGGSGDDKLIGNSVSNYLDGGAGNDELFGGGGNDYFDWDPASRSGTDRFFGEKGNDTYVFDRSTDRAYERTGEGTDTIWVTFSYSLPHDQEIENLLGFGNNDLVLNGNALNNRIKGSNGNDRLYGGVGNDTFEYTKGQDFFDGGAGVDKLLLEKSRSSYVVTKISNDAQQISLIGSTDTYTIQGIEEVQFGSVTLKVADLVTGTVDTAPPTLSSASPSDEATAVAIGSNLVLTFSEAIVKGIGTLVLKTSAGTVVESFNVATSSSVTVSGSTLTVNPTNDFAYSTGYRLEIPAGAVEDTAGNSYAGTTTYNFTTAAAADDYAASTATSGTLSVGGSVIGKIESRGDVDWFKVTLIAGKTYQFTLDANSITGAIGDPFLRLYNSAGVLLSSDDDSGVGLNAEINFTAGTTGTYYIAALQSASGLIIDPQTGAYKLSLVETAALADTTPPTLSSASPADEDTGVAIGSNLVLTFSEAIVKGTGTLMLKNSAGTVIESFNVATSSAVTVSGSTLTVNPSSDLAYSTGYRLEIPSGAIKDTAGNGFAGTTTYNFTTEVQGRVLIGTSQADVLVGGAGNDQISGLLGNDDLDGGGGADELVGGDGYDRYVLDHVLDRVIEAVEVAPAGVDVSVLEGSVYLRLQQFYIAYYGRPADYAGSVYWVNTLERDFKGNQTGMVAAFGNLQQREYVDMYGTGGTVQEFLTRVYENLFNRAPDQEGLNYWTGIINARAQQVGIGQARSESVIQILDGAQAADRLVVQAKQTVATQFSQQISLLDLTNEYGTASNAELFTAVRAWFAQVDASTSATLTATQLKAASVAAVHMSGTRLGDSVVTSVDWSRTTVAADIEHFFATGSGAVRLVGDGQSNILSGNGHGALLTGGAGGDVFWFDEQAVVTPDRILDFNADEDLIGLDGELFAGLSKGPLSQADFDARFKFDGKTLYLDNKPLYEVTVQQGTFSFSDIWVF